MGNLEWIQKIDKCYVGDDCVQVMVPYKNSTTVLGADGILFHHKKDSNFSTNKYVEDERRKQFPYSSIPIHQARVDKLFFMKRYYTNQLFEFNKTYFTFNSESTIVENYAIKHDDGALLVSKVCSPNENTEIKIMNTAEINELFENPTKKGDSTFFLKINGRPLAYRVGLNESQYSAYESNKKNMFPSDKLIIDLYRENIQAVVKGNLNSNNFNKVNILIQKIVMSDVINCTILSDFLMIKFKDNIATIDFVNVKILKEDKYQILTKNIPVTKYTLEHIKYMIPKVINGGEPKFPKSLNPNVDYEEVEKSKKMVLESKNK